MDADAWLMPILPRRSDDKSQRRCLRKLGARRLSGQALEGHEGVDRRSLFRAPGLLPGRGIDIGKDASPKVFV